MFFPKGLDLDVDARWKIQLHQRVNGLRRWLEDVDQALVRPDLELLPRLLVDVRRSQHSPLVNRRGKRNRAREARARALGRVDDLGRRLVEHARVVRLEPDSNLVAEHRTHSSEPLRLLALGSWLSARPKVHSPKPIYLVPLRRPLRSRSRAPARTDRNASSKWRAPACATGGRSRSRTSRTAVPAPG